MMNRHRKAPIDHQPRREGRNRVVRIGVDLGGTKIETAALDETGLFIERRRVATPSGADQIVAVISSEVRQLEARLGEIATVGVATPGSLSANSGLLRNSNSTCLNGLALDRLLSTSLERPIRMENDANCFALSEAIDGAGRDGETVFGVILGTGVGGGLVVSRRIVIGRNRIAGEWGHNPLPWPHDDERPGNPCYCGKTGCVETFLSGPGLANDHLRGTGERLSAASIAAAASGDAGAAATLDRYIDRLARALATVVNVLDPDIIVLGGGVSNMASLCERVAERWDRYVFSESVATRLVKAEHGDSSGVRGAAWLWD
jgi:fructokinase